MMAETKITKNYNQGGYEQIVKYLVESKEIFFIDCTCGDFSGAYTPKKRINKICSKKNICESCKKLKNDECGKEFEIIKPARWFPGRRMYKSGLFADQRFYASPCKHLQPIITIAEDQGLTLRKPKPMEGTDKCTAELRRFLIERSDGFCECGCGKVGHEVHRKIAKTNGGKYNKANCVFLNTDCHRNITYQKWQGTPGAKK